MLLCWQISFHLPLLVHFLFSWIIAAPCWSVESVSHQTCVWALLISQMSSATPTVSPRFLSTLPAGLAEPTVIWVFWGKTLCFVLLLLVECLGTWVSTLEKLVFHRNDKIPLKEPRSPASLHNWKLLSKLAVFRVWVHFSEVVVVLCSNRDFA